VFFSDLEVISPDGASLMDHPLNPENPVLRAGLNRLYREFFDHAERNRRWSLAEDIPWAEVNRAMDPAVADVIESFCAVELYLPDYIAKALPLIRSNKGWAWFHANWGYEESKHSLALGDWLLRSGSRTEEQMADLEARVFAHEWNLPHDSPSGMLIYGMVQELATWVHYRNLRLRVQERGDPALSRLLGLIAVDERCHHSFYRSVVQLFLELDRERALEQLRRVLLTFAMPAVHLLAESRRRVEQIKALGVFDDDVFRHEVYQPILAALGVHHRELRGPRPDRKSRGSGTLNRPAATPGREEQAPTGG
jgi:acyl-[acyl-carrier-protein] desaturase